MACTLLAYKYWKFAGPMSQGVLDLHWQAQIASTNAGAFGQSQVQRFCFTLGWTCAGLFACGAGLSSALFNRVHSVLETKVEYSLRRRFAARWLSFSLASYSRKKTTILVHCNLGFDREAIISASLRCRYKCNYFCWHANSIIFLCLVFCHRSTQTCSLAVWLKCLRL